MNEQMEMTSKEIAQITEQSVGVIDLTDDTLQLVAGGVIRRTEVGIAGVTIAPCFA